MSSLLYSVGRTAFRARRLVIVGWVVVLLLVGVGAGLLSTGTSNSFVIPGTPAQTALDALDSRFPEVSGAQAQMVVVTAEGQKITDPSIKAAVQRSVARLQQLDPVEAVIDPYGKNVTGALSQDDRAATVTVQMGPAWEDITDADREQLVAAGAAVRSTGATVEFGGQVFSSTGPALSPTEGIGVLIALVVLLVTFGSLRAAGMPVLTALFGVAVSMAVILALTRVVTVSSTVPLLALMIGLAVGIDYALFILSRHRDQLAEGMDPEESTARAIATAGSAVVFAGLTVIIALVGLAVARIPFLTTMGLAAAGAVLVAVLIALTLLPAVLGFSGDRLRPRVRTRRSWFGWLRLRRPSQRGTDRPEPPARRRFADRWVHAVTRWPMLSVLLVVVALAALAVPAKDLRLALGDNGTAPADSTQRQAFDLTAEHFGPGYNAPLLVTADIIRTTDPVGVVNRIATELKALPRVAEITTATPNRTADTGVIALVPVGSAESESTKQLVAQVRSMERHFQDEFGVQIAVTGQTALAIDVSDRLAGALLPFGVLVVGLSLLLLGIVFRSVAVPIKATLGYLLSVGASFGVVTAVFERGWLAGPLGVEHTGPVISFMPIILMGVLFGLAMDYEVFLVSRMREEYVHSRDPQQALTVGYAAGARVVTAAALIMVAVFAAFVPEGDPNIKPIALALAVGVFIDAFVVRMIFVPAVLALLGHAAWWLPGWLDRRLPRLDIEGEGLRTELELSHWPTPDSTEVVHAEGLGLDGPQGPVFRDVDLAVPAGTVLMVHGAPGAGKTALLLALAGRMPISAGRAKVAGFGLPGSGRSARAIRARVGLAETAGINDLEPALSVEQHVAERLATRSLRPWVSRSDVARVLDTIDDAFVGAGRTSLLGRSTLVADLSPLERKLLGLALALIGSPPLVVIDNVDDLRTPADREALWRALAWLTDGPIDDGSAGEVSAGPHRSLTVIAGGTDPAEAIAAVPPYRLQLLDLTEVRPILEKVR
jgi:putative drug exporter of the RND superfamily